MKGWFYTRWSTLLLLLVGLSLLGHFLRTWPASEDRAGNPDRRGKLHGAAEGVAATACRGRARLSRFSTSDRSENRLFLIESSGRPSLSPRQACAVESAGRSTGLQVVILLWNRFLDLSDNTTCQLYIRQKGQLDNVHFHRLDIEMDLQDTPLKSLYVKGAFNTSKHLATHLSDGLRLAFLYKYGGWYSDLDYVFLRPLPSAGDPVAATTSASSRTVWPNILATTKTFWKTPSGAAVPDHLTNSILRFQRRHPLLMQYMTKFQAEFTGARRMEVGPFFLSRLVREACKLGKKDRLLNAKGDCSGHNLTIFDSDTFHPLRAVNASQLWSRRPVDFGRALRHSYAVHFFSQLSKAFRVTGDRRREAYAFLAPDLCPISYASQANFAGP